MLYAVILKIFPQDDKKCILKITYILICIEKYSVKMIKIHIKNILSNHFFLKEILNDCVSDWYFNLYVTKHSFSVNLQLFVFLYYVVIL